MSEQPDSESAELVRELQRHQCELQVQNEELRRTQRELEAARQSFVDLFEQAPIGYCTLDVAGHVLQANPAALRLLSLGESDLLGQKLSRWVSSEDQDCYYLEARKLLKESAHRSWDLHLVPQQGKPLLVQCTACLGTTDGGEPLIRLMLMDVDERRRATEERARLQVQLQQSQRLESIGRLAGGIAHDFNNMLAVILAGVDLAADRPDLDQGLLDELAEIRMAASRSAELTSRLLAFARQQPINPRQLDLNEAVSHSLSMLTRMLGEEMRLQWRPAPDPWLVKMDPVQLDQILTNLCLNARDALGGSGTIEIEVSNFRCSEGIPGVDLQAPPGDYMRLSVCDHGCGIEAENLDKIFEPFFTTKGQGQGTGLGLATVYGSVLQNRGYVGVTSQPGKGSRFDIYLPRFNGPLEPPSAAPGVVAHGSEVILLVEDEYPLLLLTANILRRKGYIVLTASEPSQALEIARRETQIDLLLTDVILPEMNGKELADKIHQIRPSLRCLFMSGYNADVISDRGVLDPGLPFLQKPFSMSALNEKVRAVLDIT